MYIHTHSKCRALTKHTLGLPLTVCKLAKKFSATKIHFSREKIPTAELMQIF